MERMKYGYARVLTADESTVPKRAALIGAVPAWQRPAVAIILTN
jgi:hypothetical protein